MLYTIKYQSAINGDTIPLTIVAEAMARHAASAYGKSSLHLPTLENTRTACTELLLDAANKGALNVCDSTGRTACVLDLVGAVLLPPVQEGFSNSERTILALYVRAKHLCDWGGANGYEFELADVPAQEIVFDLKDENGKVLKKGYFRGYVGNANSYDVVPQQETAEVTPGTIPKIAIGKLAVAAAWSLEQSLRRRPSAKEVMDQLIQWESDGKHSDVLRLSKTGTGRSIAWTTMKGDTKEYDMEALKKALQSWWKSRN